MDNRHQVWPWGPWDHESSDTCFVLIPPPFSPGEKQDYVEFGTLGLDREGQFVQLLVSGMKETQQTWAVLELKLSLGRHDGIWGLRVIW